MNFDVLLTHPLYAASQQILLFCNQSSYDFNRHTYLFDLLIKDNKLQKILIPEHGLFSEYQDQENISDLTYKGVPCISLYNKNERITSPSPTLFEGVDAILIDIQDVGVRYFTYTTHMFLILDAVNKHAPQIPVLLVDRPNPIGNKVEGTIIQPNYTSFLGHAGLIHRHGLSTGGLCDWYLRYKKYSLNFTKVPCQTSVQHFIPPSPNLPTMTSLDVYPGQCLWEATTFSEGRGTTTPFELFGHSELHSDQIETIAHMFNQKFEGQALLRTTSFIPTHHKQQAKLCLGWQLFIRDQASFHSIFGTLFIMRLVREIIPDLIFWLTGKYEFDSEYSAAQLLLGDDDMIKFVNGEVSEDQLKRKMETSELKWISDNE